MPLRLPLLPKPHRRRWKRYWFNGSIQLWSGNRRIDAIGIQVSRGGMYLFAIADLPVGGEIRITFAGTKTTQPLEVLGTVRHRALYLYGVEFLHEQDHATALSNVDAQLNQEANSG